MKCKTPLNGEFRSKNQEIFSFYQDLLDAQYAKACKNKQMSIHNAMHTQKKIRSENLHVRTADI